MQASQRAVVSRRDFLTGSAAFVAVAAGMDRPARAGDARAIRLVAAPGRTRIVPEPYGQTDVWSFNGSVPGPEIRLRQGDRLRAIVENRLAEETSVHWHGLRVPNAMDGVPHLTQEPIAPGGSFTYEFECPDAGTFWYHPHQRSFEQVGRGLHGPLIIEEAAPVRVDRDMTWVLDDWRLDPSAAIRNDFANGHDMSHDGRIGNTVTINGRIAETSPVRAGERVRLRLINAANARIFALRFDGHEPMVIALDGQPVTPHAAEGGTIVLGPAMRADIVLDMTGKPGSRFTVVDEFYDGRAYRLVDLVYGAEPLRAGVPDWPLELPANPLAEPVPAEAERHEIVFNGGMMGGRVMSEMPGPAGGPGIRGGMEEMMSRMRAGRFWFVNGIAADGHVMEPVLTLARGRSHVIAMTNATAWWHPIHLHGHSFRVVARGGQPTAHREWRDTVLMAPRERVEIALVADNPGDWMFHCHILEHQAAGMMGVIRVT